MKSLSNRLYHKNALPVFPFTMTLRLLDRDWLFDVRMLHSADPRFEGTVVVDGSKPVDFVMIRSSIGKWLITGDDLPGQLEEKAQDIWIAFEREVARMQQV